MRPKRGRAFNPAYGSTSFTPNSYVLPSQYYKLRRIEGVSSSFGESASAGDVTWMSTTLPTHCG